MWHAIRDIFLAAINKGQLPILGVIAILAIIFARLPQDKLGDIVDKILTGLSDLSLLGYAFAVAIAAAWVLHAKMTRAVHYRETDRIGKEKSDLQQILIGADGTNVEVRSSEKPPKSI